MSGILYNLRCRFGVLFPRTASILNYYRKLRSFPHLRHPRTLNEKIQWLKFHGDNRAIAPLADKYAVREFVRGRGLEDILVPLLGKWDSVAEFRAAWPSLEAPFVIKANNSCQTVIVVKDKAEADLEPLKQAVAKAEADCLASQQEKIDEIYGKLADGEEFEALIESYGEDPGMHNEPTKTRGYYVCAESTNWDQNFTDGAMALEAVGDVSQTPVIGTSGIHIIRYESDVTPGAVPLEDIRDALYEQTLEAMKDEHYTTEVDAWIAALNPKYTISAFDLSSL